MIQRPGQKVFTVPGPDWGVQVIQPAAALEYYRKVLSYGPVAYWPVWDPFGSGVAEELVNSPAQDGMHSNVTLGQPGIGDGRTSGWYNGAISFTNVWSPVFQAVFNGSQGTIPTWVKVNDVGVWTDGTVRRLFNFRVDGNNRIYVARIVGNNQLMWVYVAGGVQETVVLGGLATTDWFHIGITWDRFAGVNGEVKAYYQGLQTGATQTALGNWAGNLNANFTIIGAQSTVPATVWHGWEQHVPVFDYALPPAAMLDLATI